MGPWTGRTGVEGPPWCATASTTPALHVLGLLAGSDPREVDHD